MSVRMSPGPRSLSPLWALLLLPFGLLAGWMIGGLERPAKSAPPAATAPGATPAASRPVTPRPAALATDDAPPPLGEPAAPPPPADAPRAPVMSEWTTMESAMAETQRDGKPILVDFNAEWCGPCRALKEQVFDDLSRGRAVRTAVIPVSVVDRAREEGSNPPQVAYLQQRFGVDAFPTLVVFSPQTGRILQTKGFGDAERTLQWIEQAAAAVQQPQ